MKLGKYRSGQPIQSKDAVTELLKYWTAPQVIDELKKQSFSGRSTAMLTPLEELYRQSVEQLESEQSSKNEQEPSVKPMTLQELEAIRKDAYEEGFTQGKDMGYKAGHESGKTQGIESGFEEGLNQGKEQGLELAQPLVDEKLQQLQTLIDSLNAPLRQYDDLAEKQLVELATILAEAVVYTEVKTNPKAILSALKLCMDTLPLSQHKCEIELHPDDLKRVIASYGQTEIDNRGWRLKPEPDLEPGGCIINSENSSIDFTLKTRLADTLGGFLLSSGIETKQSQEP